MISSSMNVDEATGFSAYAARQIRSEHSDQRQGRCRIYEILDGETVATDMAPISDSEKSRLAYVTSSHCHISPTGGIQPYFPNEKS